MTIQINKKLKPGTIIRFEETTCEKLEGINHGDVAIVLEHPYPTRLTILLKGEKTHLVLNNVAYTGLTNTVHIVSEK